MLGRIKRLLKHRWLGETEIRRALPKDVLERLTRRVAASEQRHTGEIRIYIESALPTSYILTDATPRERAISMFGKLRVWDTDQNNGVLIYLLLADHAIEIVADRGLNKLVDQVEWEGIAQRMAKDFREKHFEDGITHALEEVSALLVKHFPASPDNPDAGNELPDEPVLG